MLLISFASAVGVLFTFLELVLSAIVGSYFIRRLAFGRLHEKTVSSVPAAVPVQEFVAFLIAGLLLIIPGLITDGIGLLLAFPYLRFRFIDFFEKTGGMDYTTQSSYIDGMMSRAGYRRPEENYPQGHSQEQEKKPRKSQPIVIEAEFEDVTEEEKKNDR